MVHFQSADRVHLFQHWLRPRRVIGQASDLVDVLSQLKKVFGWNGFHQEMRRDIMWGICGKTLDKMGLGPHILARGLDPPISAKTLDHPILAAHPSQGLDHRFYPSTVLLRPILARGWTTHFINKKGWTTPFYWLGWGDLTPPPSSPRGSLCFRKSNARCWLPRLSWYCGIFFRPNRQVVAPNRGRDANRHLRAPQELPSGSRFTHLLVKVVHSDPYGWLVQKWSGICLHQHSDLLAVGTRKATQRIFTFIYQAQHGVLEPWWVERSLQFLQLSSGAPWTTYFWAQTERWRSFLASMYHGYQQDFVDCERFAARSHVSQGTRGVGPSALEVFVSRRPGNCVGS